MSLDVEVEVDVGEHHHVPSDKDAIPVRMVGGDKQDCANYTATNNWDANTSIGIQVVPRDDTRKECIIACYDTSVQNPPVAVPKGVYIGSLRQAGASLQTQGFYLINGQLTYKGKEPLYIIGCDGAGPQISVLDQRYGKDS